MRRGRDWAEALGLGLLWLLAALLALLLHAGCRHYQASKLAETTREATTEQHRARETTTSAAQATSQATTAKKRSKKARYLRPDGSAWKEVIVLDDETAAMLTHSGQVAVTARDEQAAKQAARQHQLAQEARKGSEPAGWPWWVRVALWALLVGLVLYALWRARNLIPARFRPW